MDDADTISQKIRKARTDPDPARDAGGVSYRPEALNLIGIYAALAERTAAEWAEFTGQGFGESFKPRCGRPGGGQVRRPSAVRCAADELA